MAKTDYKKLGQELARNKDHVAVPGRNNQHGRPAIDLAALLNGRQVKMNGRGYWRLVCTSLRTEGAKVILYGWVLSIPMLIAGLGTIEWAMETGEGSILLGLAMVATFGTFSLLIARHSEEVDAEAERFNKGLETLIRRGIRGYIRTRCRAFRLRLQRDRRLCREWEATEDERAPKA